MTSPQVWNLPHGEGTSALFEIYRAGIDPAGAFGAAFALNRGVPWVQQRIARSQSASPAADGGAKAGEPQPAGSGQQSPQTSLDGSASSPMDGKTTPVDPASGTPADAARPTAAQPGAASAPSAPEGSAPDPAGGRAPSAAPHTAADAAGKAAAVTGEDAAARGAGAEAAQVAKRRMAKIFQEEGAKAAVKHGVVQAVTRGATLGGRAAAAAMLRLGTLSVPGLGIAISAALWVFDTDGRKAFNGLLEHLTGTVTPDLNAPPTPGRTSFLPLTNDGNRDPVIEGIDAAMVKTNDAAFGFDANEVWPLDGSGLTTTSDFSQVQEGVNRFAAGLDETLTQISGIYQRVPDERYVAMAWGRTRPGLDKLAEFQSTKLPVLAKAFTNTAAAVNDAYQGFRRVNLGNRQAIANSNSGIWSFLGNHIKASDMSGGTNEVRTALDAIERSAPTITAAVDGLTVVPTAGSDLGGSGTGAPVAVGSPGAPPPSVAAPPVSVMPSTPLPEGNPGGDPPATAPPAAAQPAKPQQPESTLGKDLASLLKTTVPATGTGMPMQLPQIPNLIPQMPGMPQMPNLGAINPAAGLPGAIKPAGLQPGNDLTDAIQKRLDDTTHPAKKDQPLAAEVKDQQPQAGEPGKGKVPEGLITPPVVPDKTNPAATQNRAGTETVAAAGTSAGHPESTASNTVDVKGRKWTFDNPKLAALVQGMTAGEGQHSLRQVASDAGFKLPPVGQDIGTEVPTSRLQPGDAIVGAHNQNAVFLGVGPDGQAMALDEHGEVKPLHDVAKFDGPHQGFFRLADDGAPLPSAAASSAVPPHAQTVADQPAVSGPGSPTPPPAGGSTPMGTPDSTQATNTGILPGQGTGKPGLDPRNVPPNR